MTSEVETLQIILAYALDRLFNLDDESANLFKLTPEPDLGSGVYHISFGEPESEDSGDSELPYFQALVEIRELENGEIVCKVFQTNVANDCRQNTLTSKLHQEEFKRKLPKPKDILLDEPDDEQKS